LPRQERRRALSALITILFSIVILVAPLVAIAIAQSTPKITLWNPSDYRGPVEDGEPPRTPLIVSDPTTGNDEEDDIKETTYRLMATSSNTPAQALVEFELVQGTLLNVTLGSATQVGADAFEFDWDIPPSVTDGQYTLRAILYSGSGVTAIEVARDEQAVLIRNGVPAPDTQAPAADITYPVNGAPTGFYTNPISGSTNTVINAEFSANTSFIEAFYTVSDPGDEPEWKSCAGPDSVGTEDDSPAGSISFLCVLAPEDQGGLTVTGLGVVANDSPNDPFFNAEYDPSFNTSGDAIRVAPYEQDATNISIDEPTVRADGGAATCSPSLFVTVTDQMSNPIARINMDVHARGPSDQLKYRVPGTPIVTSAPSAVKVPDKGHAGNELGWACSDPSGDRQQFTTTRQGDHNVAGAPDVKHIEASSGTSNIGRFGVGFKRDVNGTTQAVIWVDEDEDDQFCDDEPFANASVGWNEPAPPPSGETAALTTCPVPDPPPPGGTPSGGPSPTETGTPGDCTLTGTSGDDNLIGTQGNDVICARAGDDTVDGRGGDDIILGESGNDLITGGNDDDTIDGGSGNDRATGDDGNDTLDGFAGVDVLSGGSGNDTLRGSKGVDGLQGGPGSDVLQGGGQDDVIEGQGGKDVIKAFNGEDIVGGGGGKDTIRGMNNNDELSGDGGNDKIIGGKGRDKCSGGKGKDRLRQCE
jgi:hypothetical protein